jgi:hypothetical protein
MLKTFGTHIVKDQKQHHLQDDRRRNRFITVNAVWVFDFNVRIEGESYRIPLGELPRLGAWNKTLKLNRSRQFYKHFEVLRKKLFSFFCRHVNCAYSLISFLICSFFPTNERN